jgi:hypothetical protein
MHNQHAGLSQLLAEQRMTQRREKATRQRPVRSARPPRRRRGRWAARGWWRLAGGRASPPITQAAAPKAPVDRSEATTSKLAPAEVMRVSDPCAAATLAIGEDAVRRAWAEGWAMAPEEAVRYATGGANSRSDGIEP